MWLSVVTLALLPVAPHLGLFRGADGAFVAPAMTRALAPSSRPPVCMLAKRGRPPKNADKKKEEEEEEDDEEYVVQSKPVVQLVDPMTTSLGKEDELLPFPGPPVLEEPVDDDDRSLYVIFSRFVPERMPNEPLQTAYMSWLQDVESRPDIRVSLPHYMLTHQSLDNWEEMGPEITDDELAIKDAEDEAALAEAEAQAQAARDLGQPDAKAEQYLPSSAVGMEKEDFVLGHLTVVRAPSRDSAAAWASGDPVQAAGGYSAVEMHEWARSTDEALTIQSTSEDQQPYCVHCIDRPDAGDLRSRTRDAHLEWLRDSARVNMAGPLLASNDGAADAPRVGTLLMVNGDDLDEVRDWAKNDPYNTAGLFASVTVQPIVTYALDEAEDD